MKSTQKLALRANRAIAYLIDILPILCLVFAVFYFLLGFDDTLSLYFDNKNTPTYRLEYLKIRNWIRDISFLVWVVYCTFMESSDKQGTFGKSLMGIKVVNDKGEKMTLHQSFIRNISKILSYFALSLGFIWILFDRKRQGWHDKISNTYVVDKNDD